MSTLARSVVRAVSSMPTKGLYLRSFLLAEGENSAHHRPSYAHHSLTFKSSEQLSYMTVGGLDEGQQCSSTFQELPGYPITQPVR
jgi:hypothetical protein